MPSFTFETSKITYSDTGSGPALLLIPGLGGQLSFWAGVTKQLAPQFRVIACDHPGSGGSDPLAGELTIERLAQIAFALLDHLGIEQTHVIGQSMGGAIAQVMVREQPGRITRLVLSSTWHSPDDSLIRGFSLRRQILERMGLEAYAQAQILSTMSAAQIASDPEKARAWEQKTITNSDPASLLRRIVAILHFDNGGDVARISCPTLVFGTGDDQVVPVHMAQALAGAVPGAERAIIATGGHFMPMTDPAGYLSHILPFLRGQLVQKPAGNVVMIGCGAIGRHVLEGMAGIEGARIRAVLVRPDRHEHYAALLGPDITVASDIADLAQHEFDYAIECGGHAALRTMAPGLLQRGIDLGVLSAGALADPETLETLEQAAATGNARLDILPGALAGIDALRALRLSGLDEVCLTSRKPPQAWAGSAAEGVVDLNTCTAPVRSSADPPAKRPQPTPRTPMSPPSPPLPAPGGSARGSS